jgi:metallo-beta-lactamase class B
MFRFLILAAAIAAGPTGQDNPEWTTPVTPYRIIGNVYYVGSRDLASYLIATPQGHILVNSNLENSVPLIQRSVEKLGFRFRDVKVLLISHAHFDHCAGSALIKKLTGAKYMVMDADVPAVEDGGGSDFQYGNQTAMRFPPAKVDRILHDADELRLGSTKLVAHLTAGHTKGCTTWTMQIADAGKLYNVVIIGSPNVNEGYQLVNNPKYPTIARDFERTFRSLDSLPCDIFLGAHGGYFDMLEKLARIGKAGPNPFVDPAGYKAYVADREKAFRAELAKQQGKKPSS